MMQCTYSTCTLVYIPGKSSGKFVILPDIVKVPHSMHQAQPSISCSQLLFVREQNCFNFFYIGRNGSFFNVAGYLIRGEAQMAYN